MRLSRMPCFVAMLLAFGFAFNAAAQTRKPDTDSESLIQTRALRFAGDSPSYRVFVQYPWLAGDGQLIPVGQINGAIARTTLDWVQHFSMSYARADNDPSAVRRQLPARLEVTYRIVRPIPRLLVVVYTRTFNDGQGADDIVAVQTDLFDMEAFRPIALRDLLSGDRWVRLVSERIEPALRQEAKQRGVTLYSSLMVRDWLSDTPRWQFEKANAIVHFRPGEVAPEAAGRFELAVPYSLFSGSIRRGTALSPLVPRDDSSGTDDRPGRTR